MKKIRIILDYRNVFSSKHDSVPYRSGMEHEKIQKYFNEAGYDVEYLHFYDVDFRNLKHNNEIYLFNSQEDLDSFYKSYIEDIVLGLEYSGAATIPAFKYLRAHNNKTFMEILRDLLPDSKYKNINSFYYGTIEELKMNKNKISYPVVIKGSGGSMSKNVALANNWEELYKLASKFSFISNIKHNLWEIVRLYKHKNYIRESENRRKFILQKFIPGLQNDWKVYVFGSKQFIFYRPIFKHRGFRASGGGYENYFYGIEANPPEGIFDFTKNLTEILDVPCASIDVAYKDGEFYLIEFQLIQFGTAGILNSKEYFIQENNKWIPKENSERIIEKVYVDSIIEYLHKKGL